MIDRAVQLVAPVTVRASQWLLAAVDLGNVDAASRRLGQLAGDAGAALRRIEPRTLRHHLLVVVSWLVVVIGLSYWWAH